MIPITENLLNIELGDGSRTIRKGWLGNLVVELPFTAQFTPKNETVITRIGVEAHNDVLGRSYAGHRVFAYLRCKLDGKLPVGEWPLDFLVAYPVGRELGLGIVMAAGDALWFTSTFVGLSTVVLHAAEKVYEGPPVRVEAPITRSNLQPLAPFEDSPEDALAEEALKKRVDSAAQRALKLADYLTPIK